MSDTLGKLFRRVLELEAQVDEIDSDLGELENTVRKGTPVEPIKELLEYRNMMTANKYQKLAFRTATNKCDLTNVALGLTGEAGEVADLVKKTIYQGHCFDIIKMKEELGDICWYIALACSLCDTDFEDILRGNIEKLKIRYPNGFSVEDSVNRVDAHD